MLKSADLEATPCVTHGFFTREGGVSQGVYASLNCGVGSNDDPEYVRENRKRAALMLGAPREALSTLYQMHSNTVITLEKPFGEYTRPEGDAMVTSQPGILLGILTADCAPVLLADPEARVIGAAHAGWKGAFNGVVPATLAAMEKLGAARERIVAAIGPCIQAASYEVDFAFRERFLQQDMGHIAFFGQSPKPGHAHFDLAGCLRDVLRREGVERTETLPNDTYGDEARFFSYRRTTLRKEKDYGRHLSAIMLNN